MWGGRFGASPDAIMADINVSIDIDRQLYRHDVAASKAHADMLAEVMRVTGSGRVANVRYRRETEDDDE